MKTRNFEILNDSATRGILDFLLTDTENYGFVNETIRGFNIRFAIITVELSDNNTGETFPALKPLPYKVKLNNGKDRLLKNIDVEILIDKVYWDNCNENEIEALLATALYSLEVVVKQDFPVYNDDGVVKMRLKKPDMMFTGFSDMANQFDSNSVERKMWNEFLNNFGDVMR